ncbi:hypothetical protein QR680_001649 [Steinernema hermaphroditum]|uniref:Uncharacterized protein n=1 Tax=Steinernema hermaphroditum TaxID=289476 RepID=A0AA39LFY9_9BILA|nr:hypothetical protein QR680_001649 [Steinernema hermaphroditum]
MSLIIALQLARLHINDTPNEGAYHRFVDPFTVAVGKGCLCCYGYNVLRWLIEPGILCRPRSTMGYNGRHSDVDLISFLYRSYSTLKNDYILVKQEHSEERDNLLQTIARLQQNESNLIDTLKELRSYCDVLLEERVNLQAKMRSLEDENKVLKENKRSFSPQDSLTSSTDAEASQPLAKQTNDCNFMIALTSELNQMRTAISESLSSAVEIKQLGEMVKQHTRELETWKHDQSSRENQADSLIRNHEDD